MSVRFINRGNKAAEIWLYGVVGDEWGGVTDKSFIKSLNDLGRVDTITLRINSEGGSVLDGYAIYNSLVRHPAYVDVQIDAFAGSIASIIAMAGDSISMAANSIMMIHDPKAISWGTAADMRKMADVLDGFRDQIVQTYVSRTKNTAENVSDWMTAETWFKPHDAVQNGFAEKITQELKIAAMIHKNQYKSMPKEFVNQLRTKVHPNKDFMALRIKEFEETIAKFTRVNSQ